MFFCLSLTYPYIQAGYPSNPRLWFERKNVFRYLLYDSQYKKKSPSGGLRGGFILSLSGACFGCLPGRQHRNGLGVRADLRSCWEWYQKYFLFYRLSMPFSKHPHHKNPSPSDPTNIKLLIPAFKISPGITGTFHTCSPNKEVI